MNKPYPLSLCDLCQISLQFQDLKWRAIIDLQYRVIGNLLVFGQFPFPVFLNHTTDFFHSLITNIRASPRSYFGPYPFSRRKALYFV